MPVAIRLVEVLTLVTLLGLLTGMSIVIVLVQRLIYISFMLLGPFVHAITGFLHCTEKVLVATLMGILKATNNLGGHA